jgi:hypothetical protein
VRLLVQAGSDVDPSSEAGKAVLREAEQVAKMTGGFKEALSILHNPPPPKKAPAPTAKAKKKPAPRPTAEAKQEPKPAAPKAKPKPDRSGSPVAIPDFRAAAESPKYLSALARLEELCGSKRQPIKDRPGGFSFHVHSSKSVDLKNVQAELLPTGCYVFTPDSHRGTELWVFPTDDRYEVIAAMQTNGANYDLMPQDVIAWMRELAEEQPFTLTGIGGDFLSGEFTTKIKQPKELAERMYEFCPDIVDQGTGDVNGLASELRTSRQLFFWWD